MRSILFRLIGILQIGGGLFGLIAMLERLYPWGMALDMILALVGVVLFATMLVAGVLLLEGSERGVRLSRWVQLAQLPVIATRLLSYTLNAGAFANLSLIVHRPLGVMINADAGVWHWLLAVAGPHTPRIGVNLLALGCWLVLRLKR